VVSSWRLLICCLCGLLLSCVAFTDTLIVAGHTQTLPDPLIVDGNEVLAPLTPTLYLLGATASVKDKAITINTSDARTLTMNLNSTKAESAGHEFTLSAAPRLVGDTLYLPSRVVATWLNAEAEYDASSTTLLIAPLLKVTYEKRDDGQAILVRSVAPVQFTSGRTGTPARTYLDFRNSSLGAPEQQIAVNEGIVQQIRLSQFSAAPPTVRMVVDLSGDCTFLTALSEQGRLLTITLHTGTVPLLQPAAAVTPVKLLDITLAPRANKQSELDVSTDGPATVDANYNPDTRQLTVRFQRGTNNLPPGHLRLPDDKIVEKVEATTLPDGTGTQLTVTCKQDVGYLITHDPGVVRITLGVFSLADMTIVLDAGHGGHDTGAMGCHGTCEKDVNLCIILRVAKLLKGAGAHVLLTRADDTFIPLDDRPGLANANHADVFVSVHCNSSPVRNSGNGTQVYYRTPQSLPLAVCMHDQLCRAIDLHDGGIRTANYLVIRKSHMPAVLLEVAFINNEREESLLCSPDFCQRAAEGIVAGLRQYASSNAWRLRRGEIPLG